MEKERAREGGGGGGLGAHGDPLLSLARTTAAADPEPPAPRNATPTSRLSKPRTVLQEGREEWRSGPGMPCTMGHDREGLQENWDSGKSGDGQLIWTDCGVPVSECFYSCDQYMFVFESVRLFGCTCVCMHNFVDV